MLIQYTHTLRRPDGYAIYADRENDRKTEYDTRQCCHCYGHWIHRPGSKRLRGICLKCYGFTCGPSCPATAGGSTPPCVPKEAYLEHLEGKR